MKQKKKEIALLSTVLGTTLVGSVYAAFRFLPKMPIKKYTKACLYLAVMDDEICRNELEGSTIGGKEIEFPSKQESLHYRYRLFLSQYKQYSSKRLETEISAFEQRLEEAKQYIGQPKEDLDLAFGKMEP